MPREEHRQIKDNANHGPSDGRENCGQILIAA
jgi:hypothetical protein